MEDHPITWAIVGLLGLFFVYKNYLHFTRDVPIEYLTNQSVAAPSRLNNELAIYKSNKLDYSQGLRVGLGILYQHYKIRNGNMNDIWQVFLHGDLGKVVFVGTTKECKLVLNHQVHQLGQFFRDNSVSRLCFRNHKSFISSTEMLAVVMACFLNQVTVVLNLSGPANGNWTVEDVVNGARIVSGGKTYPVREIIGERREKTDFVNEYHVEKDHGIALEISLSPTTSITTTTKFSQVNLVAAVASSIKHLPPGFEVASTDRVLVVQDNSRPENVTNTITKVLAAFLASAHVALVKDVDQLPAFHPTIVSAPNHVIWQMYRDPQGLDALLVLHRKYSLKHLRFSNLRVNDDLKVAPKIRLVYAYKSITDNVPLPQWNQFRASMGVHIVEEVGYPTVAGPVLLTDYFDFRQIGPPMSETVSFVGCLAQCNEYKLTGYNGDGPGDLHVRGFNIGKTKSVMKNVGESELSASSDGFFSLPVRARWGPDGCLYVFR